MKYIITGLLVIVTLSACAPSESAIQTAIVQTQSVWTPIPTQTPYPTYTPPPTSTPLPSPTIVPTVDAPTIASNVITAFKNAGLEAENPTVMSPQDRGLAPNVCYGVHFFVPSIDPTAGGRVFVCQDPGEQAAIAGYYEALGKSSAAFFSWVFTKGNIVVQINGQLPEDKARQYEAAIP